jgi:hypothetical protein
MIAISYRRQDSNPVAGRLYDRLQAEFGKGNVFMDFDSIPYGVDFRDHIKQTLKRAKVVVAIIGPDWSGGREAAPRRIDDPADFVRLEIASALENGVPIIPVLVNNTPMPEAKSLPAELEGLAFRNGLALDTGIDFHHHADRLIAGIHKVIDPPAPLSPATLPPKQDDIRRKTLLLPATAASLAVLAGIAGWYFFIHAPRQAVIHPEVTEPPRTLEIRASPVTNPTPVLNKTQSSADQSMVAASPAATPPAAPVSTSIVAASVSPPGPTAPTAVTAPPAIASTAKGRDAGRDYTLFGKIGTSDAIFRLRFEADDRVTGTYSQGGSTYRIDGHHPKDKLLLDEYTGERITAHIELAATNSASTTRWEGTMRNTPPDNRVFPVSLGDSPPAPSSIASDEVAELPGEYTYSGKIGGGDASFRLRFEAGDRVTGTYSQRGSTYRLDGRHQKGKLSLNEYTGERVSAHIELASAESANAIRWEGTMRNMPPDNRVFPVSFSRPKK